MTKRHCQKYKIDAEDRLKDGVHSENEPLLLVATLQGIFKDISKTKFSRKKMENRRYSDECFESLPMIVRVLEVPYTVLIDR